VDDLLERMDTKTA